LFINDTKILHFYTLYECSAVGAADAAESPRKKLGNIWANLGEI